jgi:CBS domain-containing protein
LGGPYLSNAKEFLKLYNELTDYLRVNTRADNSIPYSKLVDRAGEISAPIRRLSNSLKDFGDLRNAIVHHRAYPEEIIAEPLGEAVIQFRSILEEIRSPRKIIPAFEKKVQTFLANELLARALSFMLEKDFSQIPVVRDGTLTLLTVEGIAKWLEDQARHDSIVISEVTIEDALRKDISSSFLLMSSNHSVYDAREAFAESLERDQPRLYAILITRSGDPRDELIGIITPWDLLGDRGIL